MEAKYKYQFWAFVITLVVVVLWQRPEIMDLALGALERAAAPVVRIIGAL